MRNIFLAIALLGSSSLSFADNPAMPIMVGGEEGLDACTSLGVVSGLDPEGDAFLAVRAGADAQYKLLDKLPEGKQVHICSTSPDGKWLGVVYSRKKGQDCGVSKSISPAQPYKGKCKSGWVSIHWVKVIAG